MDMKTAQGLMATSNRLRALAVLQKKAKRARKRIPADEYAKLKKAVVGDVECWDPAYDVISRKLEITALLNFLHELRGKPPCHKVRKGWQWKYDQYWKELHLESEAA